MFHINDHSADSPYGLCKLNNTRPYKKARESEFHRSSRVSGLRIALLLKISNAEAHAVCILNCVNNITKWALNIALPCSGV